MKNLLLPTAETPVKERQDEKTGKKSHSCAQGESAPPPHCRAEVNGDQLC
jgi:hypothetical protein